MSRPNRLMKFPDRAPGFLAPREPVRLLDSAATGGTKLSSIPFPSFGPSSVFGSGSGFFSGDRLLPSTKVDYAREVGDGLGSSVLMAPLNWLMRTFPEAPPIVEKRTRQGQWSEVYQHPLTSLIENPNPFYSGLELTMATVLDLAFGNAYWLKLRNQMGEVVQLWWAPRTAMVVRYPTDGSKFIDRYGYVVNGREIPVPVEDVVHFRFGMDPRDIRLGLSPLGALMRDVVMDDQAANFATAILKNLGIIGVVISPETASAASKPAIQETKEYVAEHFTGDNRGKPLALGAPTKVDLLQYNMQGFDVSPLRDVSEERVCAALGIPAAVVGFGTGLQQTKVGATMKEMRQLAWTGGLMPLQKIVANTIGRGLLADPIFADGRSYAPPEQNSRTPQRMRFDNNQVRALWEDSSAKHDRVRKDYLAGVITRGEARTETGRAAGPNDNVYIQPVNVTQLDENGDPKPLASGDSAPADTGSGGSSDSTPAPSSEEN